VHEYTVKKEKLKTHCLKNIFLLFLPDILCSLPILRILNCFARINRYKLFIIVQSCGL